jgi:5-formyltetrahydrofolate cyclo-ligase
MTVFPNVSERKKIGVNYFNPDENIDDVWENDIPRLFGNPYRSTVFFSGLE